MQYVRLEDNLHKFCTTTVEKDEKSASRLSCFNSWERILGWVLRDGLDTAVLER